MNTYGELLKKVKLFLDGTPC